MSRPAMRLLTTTGVVSLPGLSRAQASLAGRYANALQQYWSTGDTSVLAPFAGVRIAGHVLVTDPGELDWWGMTGEASYESIYDDSIS